jgi:phage terminase large subunit
MAAASNTATQFSVSSVGINSYQPRKAFQAFHNRDQRWSVMVCHRRAGKTVACVAELVLSALFTNKQDARYAYVGPQLNQVKDVAWMYVKRLTADIPGIQYNETELRVDLPNGARVRLYGADNPDRLRGLYLDGVVLDEFADMRSSVWGEIIRPMLADRKGWAVFIGTPKGHNEFYDLWKNSELAPEWYRVMLRASESGIVDKDELIDAAKSMTDDQYAQEFECSFEAAVAGAYYAKEFDQIEKDGRILRVDYDKNLPVHTSWDIGYSDDTAVWFYQMVRGELHVIDFYAANGYGVEHYVDMLNSKLYKYYTVGKYKGLLMLPHDARAKTFAASGKSVQQQFEELGYTSRITPELSLQDGIQALRMTLPKCYFDRERCFDGIEALKLYRREWDDDKRTFKDRPLHDWTSHAADAARYMGIAWREIAEKTETRRPKFDTERTFNEIIELQRRKRLAEE